MPDSWLRVVGVQLYRTGDLEKALHGLADVRYTHQIAKATVRTRLRRRRSKVDLNLFLVDLNPFLVDLHPFLVDLHPFLVDLSLLLVDLNLFLVDLNPFLVDLYLFLVDLNPFLVDLYLLLVDLNPFLVDLHPFWDSGPPFRKPNLRAGGVFQAPADTCR